MSTAPTSTAREPPRAPSAPPTRLELRQQMPPLRNAHLQARSAMRESAMPSILLPLSGGRRAQGKVFDDIRQPIAGARAAACLQQKGVRATRGAQAVQRHRMMRERRLPARRLSKWLPTSLPAITPQPVRGINCCHSTGGRSADARGLQGTGRLSVAVGWLAAGRVTRICFSFFTRGCEQCCTLSHFCNVHISVYPAGNHLLLSFLCQEHKLSLPQPWGQVLKHIYMSVTGKLKLLPKKCYKRYVTAVN